MSKNKISDVKRKTSEKNAKTNVDTIQAEVTNPTETEAAEAAVKNLGCDSISKCSRCRVLSMLVWAAVVLCVGGLLGYNLHLSKRLSVLEQNMGTMQNSLSQNVDDNRRIYVFNMDETVRNIGLQEANQRFEEGINDLDEQVKEAQATIKDLKDEAMKAKILNLTIKPLQMKRDDLLQAYSKSMQDSLAKINTALAEIATENNVPVIFINKSIAVNTNYVIDVTPQVIEKIRARLQ